MKGEKGMKNINKNAVQALWLDGKAYLAHKAIDGFMMGQGEFTIETTFICNDVNDCLIYAQEQGFEFGIRDKHLYFEMEGVGSITQEGVSVDTDIMFFAAVTCREGKLTLYFEGLPAADAIDVKLEATGNSGNYVIGKGLNGYIVDLRLRSCGMEDQEILLENGAGLKEYDSVEFWGDFTTVQYRDKSHNALSLWTEQGIVKCMNVTSCTKLSLRGGFATVASNSYESGYTLLFKVYPQVENTQKMYIYSAVSGNRNAVFSIGIEPDDNGDSHAFVEHNGETYHCETILPLAEWVDIGLRIEGADAALYVDGVKRLTFTFEGELSNITGIIGIKPFQNKISYKNSFWGYLDYFAEFECALDEGKIAFYAEEQPYIFDESIRTLYAFFCGEPIDLVSGSTLLLAGQSRPVFEKNLNSMTAPIGMDLRVPQEVCAEWQELSEYEQWATTTAMDMVRETYSQSMGLIAADGTLPIEQTATKQIRELYAEQIEEVKTLWTPENQDMKSRQFMTGASLRAVGGVGMVVGGSGLAALGVVGAKFMSTGPKVMAAVGGTAFVGGTLAGIANNISEKESTATKKMPVNDEASIELVYLSFNHNGNPELGSIHFHSDTNLVEPSSMVYSLPEQGHNMNMLLILSKLGEALKVTLGIRNKSSNQGYHGSITMQGHQIFEQDNTIIDIPPLTTCEYTLKLPIFNHRNISYPVECYRENFIFYAGRVPQELILLCQYDVMVYLQQDLPIEPWELHINEAYQENCKKYPSLDFVCNMIITKNIQEPSKGLQAVFTQNFMLILNRLYDSGILKYEPQTHFTRNVSNFDLLNFLRAIAGIQGNIQFVEVNCTDCANIVSLIAAHLGIRMDMNLIFGMRAFCCNQVVPMAANRWVTYNFAYHQVAFYSEGHDFTKNAEIYDLSLKIDRGPSPNEDYTPESMDKVEFLSGGYFANQTDDFIINITEPYDLPYYLERLVKNHQRAGFLNAKISTELYFGEEIAEQNELYTTLMQHYIQNYGLDDEKYAEEIPQSEVRSALFQEMSLKSKTQMRYECVWSAPNDKEVTWFLNVEHLSAGEYLASVLMRYSCYLTEKDAPELGERVFYGPDLLITYFAGNAYAIRCKDMEEAEETARRLKDSINQQTI